MSCLQQAIDLYERGHTLNREGKHSSALPVLCEANEVAQGGLEENTTLRGEIQYTLGFVLSQLGQLQDAEERFRSAIQTFTTTLQENDNVIAISLDQLGVCLREQQKLDEAERVSEQAVQMFKLSPNKSDINLVFALQNQAETFRRQGKYMAAVETYAECLRIEEAYYGRKHEATIDTIFNLAVCLKEYNNSEDAVALLHEVVQSESVLNLKPISKAQSLLQLAECLNNLGLFGQAEEHITRAHELFDFDTLTDGDSLVQQVVKEMDRSRRGQYHLPERCDVEPQIEENNNENPKAIDEFSHLQPPICEDFPDKPDGQTEGNGDQMQLQLETEELAKVRDKLMEEVCELREMKAQLQQGTQPCHDEGQVAMVNQGRASRSKRRVQSVILGGRQDGLENNVFDNSINEEDVEMTGIKLSTGDTYRALWRGVPVAVKKLNKLKTMKTVNMDQIRHELSVCSQLQHPAIQTLYGVVSPTSKPLQLVTELLEASLTEIIDAAHSSGTRLSLREQIDLTADCFSGVSYLHHFQPSIIHGDIRPANILVTSTMNAKLSCVSNGYLTSGPNPKASVSSQYVAPETRKKGKTKQSDVYSLGMIAAMIFSGQHALRFPKKNLSKAVYQPIHHICHVMTVEPAEDRITAPVAFERVARLRKESGYGDCPAKRMVKGKIHGEETAVLVDKPWQ